MEIPAGDHTLADDTFGAWIEVGDISVWVHRAETGVMVSLYRRGHEMEDAIDSAFAECEAVA